ncbi:hypothetical protein OHT76_05535 [Streptomyces sp. NBC_00287]|uniref:hypothetical protein n=1 Tax=Streptomyces sp. NBC_00287 TaxID=2975702 RepID=UPI002E28693D|nr:hypothetical protein [Streptomyces sp. NBC_00287]
MRIDLAQARATVQALAEALEALDGTEVIETPTREARRKNSDTSRTLLRLSHLGNRASVEIMDVYHAFKERDSAASGGEH